MLIKQANEHIQRTVAACYDSPEALFRAGLMAVASMRVHSRRFWGNTLPIIYSEYVLTSSVTAVNELVPDFARMKFKRQAIEYLDKYKNEIWWAHKRMNAKQFFYYLNDNVPGLGPVKSAFIVQISKGKLGCIDTVNAKRYGIEMPNTPKKYLETLEQIGETPGRMWRDWCNFVAKRDGMISYKLSEAHALFVERGRYDPACLFLQRNLFEVNNDAR